MAQLPTGAPESHAEVQDALHAEVRSDISIDALRLAFDGLTGLLNVHLPPIARQVTRIPFNPGSTTTLDVMVPAGEGPHPVLVYIHGGAWVAGSPSSHRKLAARFVEAGFLVMSVDYRLAPEYPFPAGFDDCVAAVEWAAANAEQYGGDASRLAVGGDSAGANLAAASAIALKRRRRGPKPHALLLIYGVFDLRDMGSVSANRAIHRAYLPGPLIELLNDPRVSPIRAAAELPPSFIVVGRQDPLLDQSRRLRDLMSTAGITYRYVEASAMPHGFMQMEFLGGVRPLIEDMTSFLRDHRANQRRSPWHWVAWNVFRRWRRAGAASEGATARAVR